MLVELSKLVDLMGLVNLDGQWTQVHHMGSIQGWTLENVVAVAEVNLVNVVAPCDASSWVGLLVELLQCRVDGH